VWCDAEFKLRAALFLHKGGINKKKLFLLYGGIITPLN
jgi:hypothetical protein